MPAPAPAPLMLDVPDLRFIRPDTVELEPSTSSRALQLQNLLRGKWNDRLVVVKKLSVEVSEDTLQRQARIWHKFVHPHVSRIYGIADLASDPLFVLMPYYDNENVGTYINNNPDVNRLELISQVASGMQYLHNNGIIHGGLKPTNLLITDEGRIVVADVGMFELQPSKNSESHRYLSPEAWQGTFSRQSDVYAFAMCALEIITSVLPWGALSEKHIYQLVVYENTRPDRPDELSDDLWSIITSSWHQEARGRPSFDVIAKLWRAETSPTRDDRSSPSLTLRDTHRRKEASFSMMSVRSGGSGPPAYDANPGPSTAPAIIQNFPIERAVDDDIGAERPHGYSWYSSSDGHGSSETMNASPPPEHSPTTQLSSPPPLSPPATAPPTVHRFPTRTMHGQQPSQNSSWFSSTVAPSVSNHAELSSDSQDGSSSSGRSITTPLDRPLLRARSRSRGHHKHVFAGPGVWSVDEDGPAFYAMSDLSRDLPRMDSRSEYTRRWETSQRTYTPQRQGSFSDIVSIKTASFKTVSDSDRASAGARSTAVLLVGALQAELNGSRNTAAIDSYLVKIYQSAADSEKDAQKLITAGVAPALIHLLKTRAAELDGLELVLITLGTLAHDPISANMIYRTNTALTLVELCKSAISNDISTLSVWCLIRICRSAEVAQGLIKQNIVSVLLRQSAVGDMRLDSMALYCIGTLVQNDGTAEFLSAMDIIPFVVKHLRQSTESPKPVPDHICAGLYAVARISRSIKLAKSLAKAGCIDLLTYHLHNSEDPSVLHWSARAVGCLMRPNSSDMAKALLDADIAKGLARVPTILASEDLQALGSLGFAVQRFSCAEWSGKIRQTLVEAGVVDSLLAALRTAADEPCYDVHIELALAISLLGDVGGSSIRKEIVNAGGITILKNFVADGDPEVVKACNMAITSITGNVWTRNAASAKTAMAHNWNGGCPAYQPPCPLVLSFH